MVWTDEAAGNARHGGAFRRARRKAGEYVRSPSKLSGLVARAFGKVPADPEQAGLWARFRAGLRLLRAYANGSYRQIPKRSLLMLVAATVYLVMPLDAIPDFIPVAGFLDDAAVWAWTLRAVGRDVEEFMLWEEAQPDARDEFGPRAPVRE